VIQDLACMQVAHLRSHHAYPRPPSVMHGVVSLVHDGG